MQFTYPIEVVANTEKSDPVRVQTKLCVGVLQKVSIYFPWGCAGLCGVRILHYEHQLYPTNPGDWYTGNEIYIEFESEYLIVEGPNEFKVEAYNLDDFYSHTPVVGFNVLRGGMGPQGLPGWVEG